MPAFDYSPITDAREVEAFLARLPLAVDRARFSRFVLGFPHAYLQATPPVEIVRHFGLVSTLDGRHAASSLARQGELWRLLVVARDRRFLFSHIAGSVSLSGGDIVSAEAFANTEAVVLDTFLIRDTERRFERPEEGRRFQAFLDRVIDGRTDLEGELRARAGPVSAALSLEWDDHAHPRATRLGVTGPDRFALLHAISRRISEAGCDVEIAHIETRGGTIRDSFYLTEGGRRPTEERRKAVEVALAALAGTAGAVPGG